MMSTTYLSDTTIISAQNIVDRPPRMFVARERDAVAGRERFLDRVERAGADVAEHDAQRGERQRGLGGLTRAVSFQEWRKLPLRRGKGKFELEFQRLAGADHARRQFLVS